MRKRNWLWIALAAAAALVAIGLINLLVRSDLHTRQRLIRAIEKRFDAQVELRSLDISLFPHPTGTGEQLVVRRNGAEGIPPLITIRKFSASTPFMDLLSFTPHVRRVRLEGLEIHTPPRGEAKPAGSEKHRTQTLRFVMDEIVADGTILQMAPRAPGREPLTFDIRQLRLHSAGVNREMSFHAVLRNPTPPGDIQTNGEFGPWNVGEPGDTPVRGNYTFRNASLAVFRGIAGTLSSDGRYTGALNRIEVSGTTDVPDFSLTAAGHPMHLTTRFHSIVDGTNGNTILEPVDAQLERTRILCRGSVTGTHGVKGKDVSLETTVKGGRIEDLLRLAVKRAPPPLTGTVDVSATLEVPQGDRDVLDKLKLDGRFAVTGARFSSLDVEQKLATLSRHARGHPEQTGPGSVLSSLNGSFKLNNGVISFSNLSFGVPGALLELTGTYGLHSEQIDFRGTVRLEAKLSQMVTGWKSVLLKAVDPFFNKKGAGTLIPIRITGTRSQPSFGLAFGSGR